jgi:succinate dehydrogenase/fumarate reductase flavoprotein subunit
MNLSVLLALVDGFRITDKRLLRARAALKGNPDEAVERAFRKEAQRYFQMLAREAQEHVAEVDRRLDDTYQRQFNLNAERAVAQRRLEGARDMLRALDKV